MSVCRVVDRYIYTARFYLGIDRLSTSLCPGGLGITLESLTIEDLLTTLHASKTCSSDVNELFEYGTSKDTGLYKGAIGFSPKTHPCACADVRRNSDTCDSSLLLELPANN